MNYIKNKAKNLKQIAVNTFAIRRICIKGTDYLDIWRVFWGTFENVLYKSDCVWLKEETNFSQLSSFF